MTHIQRIMEGRVAEEVMGAFCKSLHQKDETDIVQIVQTLFKAQGSGDLYVRENSKLMIQRIFQVYPSHPTVQKVLIDQSRDALVEGGENLRATIDSIQFDQVLALLTADRATTKNEALNYIQQYTQSKDPLERRFAFQCYKILLSTYFYEPKVEAFSNTLIAEKIWSEDPDQQREGLEHLEKHFSHDLTVKDADFVRAIELGERMLSSTVERQQWVAYFLFKKIFEKRDLSYTAKVIHTGILVRNPTRTYNYFSLTLLEGLRKYNEYTEFQPLIDYLLN